MKRTFSMPSLITVISLLLGVIWLSPTFAVAAPAFDSLGQVEVVGLDIPGAMDFDAAGNLYVADARGDGLVFQVNPYGELLQSFDLHASGLGLAVNPKGSLLYFSRGQSVVIFDLLRGVEAGSLSGSPVAGGEFGLAGKVDLDADGNVYVVDTKSARVKIYNEAGQYLNSFGGAGSGSGQFRQIGGMAVNLSGQVVVSDSSLEHGVVQVFTLDTSLNVIGVDAYAKTSAVNFGSPAMNSPRGMAFDAQGRGYFVDYLTSSIRIADAGFGALLAYVSPGFEAGQLTGAGNAAFDVASNRLFVGCGSARIEIFGVDGVKNPQRVNHAPDVPTQLEPIGSSEVDSTTPTLVFSAHDEDGDVLSYQVVIMQGDEEVFRTESGSTSVTVAGLELEENSAYTWTVQASDGKLSSAPTEPASFSVNAKDEGPAAPQLLTPADGGQVAGVDILSWSESTDPDPNDYITGYQLEIARDAAFSDVLTTQAHATTSLVFSELYDYAMLEDGTSYFWRVSAFDRDETASVENAVGSFVYDTTVLTVTANVPGAQVYLGGNHAFTGRLVGTTPLELRDISDGVLSLVVERAGFEPYVTSLLIGERDNASHAAVLVPAMQVDGLRSVRQGINGRRGVTVDGNAVPFLVDFDNNGTLDLLVGDAAGQVELYADMELSSRSRLVFAPGVTLALPVLPGAVPFLADWDNDGRKDLLVGLDDGTVKLFLNVGQEETPAFGEGQDLNVGSAKMDVGFAAAPAVVDYDGDGRKDLLVGNGDGLVQIFVNNGSDAAPQLSQPVTLFNASGAVVPMPVDWDADGLLEVMVTTSGTSSVYALQDDNSYLPVVQIDASDLFAAFPVDLDGDKGKDLIVGGQNGELALLKGNSNLYVASFQSALLDKADEVAGLVAATAPELLTDVATLIALIESGDYASAAGAAEGLALMLTADDAQAAAFELAELLK